MEQTRGLFSTCDSSVARCQSQLQFHFWRMSLMFKAYCTGKWACQLSIIFCHSWGYERLQKSEGSLKDCFKNVNISVYSDISDYQNVYLGDGKHCVCQSHGIAIYQMCYLHMPSTYRGIYILFFQGYEHWLWRWSVWLVKWSSWKTRNQTHKTEPRQCENVKAEAIR